jgi:hypothetical protein
MMYLKEACWDCVLNSRREGCAKLSACFDKKNYVFEFLGFSYENSNQGGAFFLFEMSCEKRGRLHLNSTRLHLNGTRLHLNGTRLHLNSTRLHLNSTRLHLNSTRLHLNGTRLHLNAEGFKQTEMCSDERVRVPMNAAVRRDKSRLY